MSAAQPSQKPYNIAIIGGGIGGVVLAIGLARQGIPFHLYESARGFGEIGAGIASGPNSVRALGLTSPDLLTAYKKHATYNDAATGDAASWLTFRYGMNSRNGNGKCVGDVAFDMGSQTHADSWTGTCVRSCVHRARFLDEIIKFVPAGTTSFSKSLGDLEETDKGVKMRFADGSEAVADAVIGCDGIKSRARHYLHGDGLKPRFTGEYAYRALVPVDAAVKALGRELAVNGQLYMGYGGYFITYPVEHTKNINVVGVVCKPGTEWKHEGWLKPSSKEEMQKELTGWHPGLVELVAEYGSRDQWALHDLIHDETCSRGRVCLLGDSFHASTPHLGAGAGQAIEDAYVLSNLLGCTERKEDLVKTFEAYDAVRRPRSQQVVRFSRAQGLACAFLDEKVKDDHEAIGRKTKERYDWIWDEDLEAQLDNAKSLMGR